MESKNPVQIKNSDNSIIKEEISLNLNVWLPAFYVIYFCSFLIPGVIFMLFMMVFYLPYFLEVRNFISLFTNLPSLIASVLIPFVIIICYLIHLFIVALITRWYWSFSEKRSPSKSGIIPRNITSKTLNFYHFRSFIIKYPKNTFSRGPFPWLLKWILGGHSLTTVGQVLEENWLYLGAPAKKFKKNVFFDEGLEEIIKGQLEKKIESQEKFEDLYTMRVDH